MASFFGASAMSAPSQGNTTVFGGESDMLEKQEEKIPTTLWLRNVSQSRFTLAEDEGKRNLFLEDVVY